MATSKESPGLPPGVFRVRDCSERVPDDDYRPAIAIGYHSTWIRQLLFWSLVLCTCGIFLLLSYWWPALERTVRYTITPKPLKASRYVIISEAGKSSFVRCSKLKLSIDELRQALPSCIPSIVFQSEAPDVNQTVETIVCDYRCIQLIFNIWTYEFERLSFNTRYSPEDLRANFEHGISTSAILTERQTLYGPGCVEVPMQPLHKLIVSEIFHPFYVFQMCAIGLWLWDGYYQYASAILIITFVSLCVELFESRRNQKKLQKMARFVCEVTVKRQKGPLNARNVDSTDKEEVQTSTYLVPGDVVQIYRGMTMPCDIVLLTGSAIVNESMLTGESIPIVKNHLPHVAHLEGDHLFDVEKHSSYILYGGTAVVDVRTPCGASDGPWGLVVRTGFCSFQGQMMRSILFPTLNKKVDFKRESYKFLAVLFLLACIGCVLSIIMTMNQGLQATVVAVRSLDTFTNAVPPALPATMTVGSTMAVTKLKRIWKILCIAPSRVNVAGQVNTVVFDKTGTLTEEMLEFEGVLGVETHQKKGRVLGSLARNVDNVEFSFVSALACCHSVAQVDGTLIGDPMEVQLVEFSKWRYINKESDDVSDIAVPEGVDAEFLLDARLPYVAELRTPVEPEQVVRVVKRFDFVPALRRMSVILWDRTSKKLSVVCKGSPEQLEALCVRSSLPSDFADVLSRYTETGMRVLAVCSKELPLDPDLVTAAKASSDAVENYLEDFTREEAESELHFVGLCIFANSLKPDSHHAVTQLLNAGCRCLMATGDNALTATAVAREAGIIQNACKTVIVGDVAYARQGKDGEVVAQLIWSPVFFGRTMSMPPTAHGSFALPAAKDGASTPTSASDRLSPHNSNEMLLTPDGVLSSPTADRGSTATDDSSQRRVEVVVNVGGPSTKPMNTGELIRYLYGRDPRDTVLVLSGPAFRVLKKAHIAQGFQFCNAVLGAPRVAVSTKKQKKTTWRLEARKKLGWDAPLDLSIASGPLEIIVEDGLKSAEDIGLHISYEIETPGSELGKALTASTLADRSNLARAEKGSFERLVSPDKKSFSTAHSRGYVNMSLFEYSLRYCRVFARMTPEDKASLVSSLQKLPYGPLVGMCGDGANDCAALKAADVGISLSEKEASIAAPFTSSIKSAQSVVDVLREGRGALMNSFQSFKFIALYALVQLISTSILYYYGGNLTDPQFLWIDLVVVLPLAMTMAYTNSSSQLSSRLPPRRLAGLPVILSLIGHVLIQFGFMLIGIAILTPWSFYVRFEPDTEVERFGPDDLAGYENTVIFLIANFQCLVLNFIMSFGQPWRKRPLSNWIHTSILIVLVILSLLALLIPYKSFGLLSEWLSIVEMPETFRWILLGLICVNSLITGAWEWLAVGWAGRREERNSRPAHIIDMVLPLERRQPVYFD